MARIEDFEKAIADAADDACLLPGGAGEPPIVARGASGAVLQFLRYNAPQILGVTGSRSARKRNVLARRLFVNALIGRYGLSRHHRIVRGLTGTTGRECLTVAHAQVVLLLARHEAEHAKDDTLWEMTA